MDLGMWRSDLNSWYLSYSGVLPFLGLGMTRCPLRPGGIQPTTVDTWVRGFSISWSSLCSALSPTFLSTKQNSMSCHLPHFADNLPSWYPSDLGWNGPFWLIHGLSQDTKLDQNLGIACGHTGSCHSGYQTPISDSYSKIFRSYYDAESCFVFTFIFSRG